MIDCQEGLVPVGGRFSSPNRAECHRHMVGCQETKQNWTNSNVEQPNNLVSQRFSNRRPWGRPGADLEGIAGAQSSDNWWGWMLVAIDTFQMKIRPRQSQQEDIQIVVVHEYPTRGGSARLLFPNRLHNASSYAMKGSLRRDRMGDGSP